MALIKKRSSRANLFIAILAAIAVGGVLYFTIPQLFPSQTGSEDVETAATRDLKIVTDFGADVFSDPRFDALRQFGHLPVTVDPSTVGRSNPFLAF